MLNFPWYEIVTVVTLVLIGLVALQRVRAARYQWNPVDPRFDRYCITEQDLTCGMNGYDQLSREDLLQVIEWVRVAHCRIEQSFIAGDEFVPKPMLEAHLQAIGSLNAHLTDTRLYGCYRDNPTPFSVLHESLELFVNVPLPPTGTQLQFDGLMAIALNMNAHLGQFWAFGCDCPWRLNKM